MYKKTHWFPLFSTNFMSVLNDNFMKWFIIFVFIMRLPHSEQGMMISIANGLFVIPYILFSSIAGRLTQKYTKVLIVQRAKLVEIPIMIITAIGFIMGSLSILLAALFLMGVQSCLFSPSKYGLIRDIGGKSKVSFGTGAMEMLTFLGVLIGTYLGGEVADTDKYQFLIPHHSIYISVFLLLFAVVGWLLSLRLKASEQENHDEPGNVFFISFISSSVKWAKVHLPALNYVVLGLAFFWLIASLIQMNLILYCERIFAMSSSEIGLTQAFIAISIALGSVITGIISRNTVKLQLVKVGAVMMIFCLTMIYILPVERITFYILISFTAFFAGMFKIPLNAWLQANVKEGKLGEMIAFNNLMVFIFILLSAGIFGLLTSFINTDLIFPIIAMLTLLITIILFFKLPKKTIS